MTFIGILINSGLKKKTVAADAKLRLPVKMILMRVVFQGIFYRWARLIVRSSCSETFYKKGVLKYFVKYTGKHLCRGLFLVKLY